MLNTIIKVNKVEVRSYNDQQMYLITDDEGNIWGDWGNKFNRENRMEEGKRYRIDYLISGKYRSIKYWELR